MKLRKILDKKALFSLVLIFGMINGARGEENKLEAMTKDLLGMQGKVIKVSERTINDFKIMYVTTQGSDSVASEGGLAYDDEKQKKCYIWLAQEFKDELKKEFPHWPNQAFELVQKHEEGHCQNGYLTKKIATKFQWTSGMMESFSKIIHPQMTWLEDSGRWAMRWQESVADAYMALSFLQNENGLKESEKIKVLKELAQWRNERWSSGEDPNSGITINEIIRQVENYKGASLIPSEDVDYVMGRAIFKNFTDQHTVLKLKQKMEQGFAQEAVVEMMQLKTNEKFQNGVAWLDVESINHDLSKNINSWIKTLNHEPSPQEWAEKVQEINLWANQWITSKDIKNVFDALNQMNKEAKFSMGSVKIKSAHVL